MTIAFINYQNKPPHDYVYVWVCAYVFLCKNIYLFEPPYTSKAYEKLNFPGKDMAARSSILAGKFHGQRSLVGYTPWSHKELDMTEHTTQKLNFLWFQGSSV